MRPKIKKLIFLTIVLFAAGFIFIVATISNSSKFTKSEYEKEKELVKENMLYVPMKVEAKDRNSNGRPDALDLVEGAREEARKKVIYDASYFPDGFPPEGRGACTDVIWRAFKRAGYDLKSALDEDIRRNPEYYGETGRRPDPKIDFRRVRNLRIFFKRHFKELTISVQPNNLENLIEWQPGDIVFFGKPYEHVAIISDKRRNDGVPLIIHNPGPHAVEDDSILNWPTPITEHFRF